MNSDSTLRHSPAESSDSSVSFADRAAVTLAEPALWKEDWPAARRALSDWWHGKGLALHVTAPRERPWEPIPPPPEPTSLEMQWLSPEYRLHWQQHLLANTYFGGVAVPIFKANIGPGSLGLILGAEGRLSPDTVWYEPTLSDPDQAAPLRFVTESPWWQRHLAIIDRALRHAPGRYLVGYPDLIENIDTLAQLRGSEQTLMDLVERPEWVLEKLAEINHAYFAVFDALQPHLRDAWGGNSFHAFALWGPGKTAKVQCDFCCMISPRMFRRFVKPFLAEQCAWLDYAMYHLDGTQALPQLPALLEIESLRAIEWTPQAGLPTGGSPEWYPLYRRIRAAGKSVQAINVLPEEVEPLIDAVGSEGLFIITRAESEQRARDLLERVGWNAS
jgi:hypothetical protein